MQDHQEIPVHHGTIGQLVEILDTDDSVYLVTEVDAVIPIAVWREAMEKAVELGARSSLTTPLGDFWIDGEQQFCSIPKAAD